MNTATTRTFHGAAVRTPKLIAVLAVTIGLAIVYVTGFASSATLHNAAHDTRHAMAFPCH